MCVYRSPECCLPCSWGDQEYGSILYTDVEKGSSGGLSNFPQDKESPEDLMRSYRWERKLSRVSWNQELPVLSGMAAGESYLLSSEL